MADRTVLAQADACDFDPAELFGRGAFERVFISYALSMIPNWQAALKQAAACVAEAGKLEVVDFGQQEGLPTVWRRALFSWLARFHVAPRPDLKHAIEGLAADLEGFPHMRSLYRGYAVRGGLIRV